MRAVVGGSEMDVARRIGTDVAVIMDLEAGAVHDLPPWSTTSRVVERYGSMAGVDVTAVLAAMARLMRPAEPLTTTIAIGDSSNNESLPGILQNPDHIQQVT